MRHLNLDEARALVRIERKLDRAAAAVRRSSAVEDVALSRLEVAIVADEANEIDVSAHRKRQAEIMAEREAEAIERSAMERKTAMIERRFVKSLTPQARRNIEIARAEPDPDMEQTE